MDKLLESAGIPNRLKQFADEWHQTLDNIKDPVFLMDRSSNVVWGNKRYNKDVCSCGGCSENNCCNVLHQELSPSQECPLRVSMVDGCAHALEVVGRNGEPLLVMVLPVFDLNKDIIGAVHLTTDLTQHKDTRELVNLLQLINDSAHGVNNGLAIVKTNLDILGQYVNVLIYRENLIGKLRESVISQSWQDAVLYARQL